MQTTAVYLVRSLRTYARNRSLTTGTFNLVVKDRIAVRLSGANSVQPETHKCDSARPRNPTNIRAAKNPVNDHIPQDFHLFSTMEKAGQGSSTNQKQVPRQAFSPIRNNNASDAAQTRATIWPSASRSAHFGAGFLGRAKAEDRKLRKELALEVPCFEGTLQKPTGVSESSPVAGTN